MDSFITSYWGMYAIQTVLHSIIASALIDCAFIAWDIREPHMTQRFRFLVIFLPAFSFPLYQLISPGRGGVYFRLRSLLDSNKWFFFDFWGIPAFKALIVLSAAITAIVFILQEFLPMVVHLLEQFRGAEEDAGPQPVEEEALARKMADALEGLPIDPGRVSVLDDEDLTLYSNTWRDPRIFISRGLLRVLERDQLQAAFAHEVGHIRRSRKPVLTIAYVLRVLMFYNPVAMIEFRKLAQEEEKICDDFAIALTGKPQALREAVEVLRPEPADEAGGRDAQGGEAVRRGAGDIAAAFDKYSLDALLISRLRRIGRPRWDELPWGVPYFVTLALIAGINYFVV
ncbi:MAG: M48 family metalloprotease [Nitrospiraceae bacterium]|nr:M48 family metalloprotease [Nitrospiraceae bacterium]